MSRRGAGRSVARRSARRRRPKTLASRFQRWQKAARKWRRRLGLVPHQVWIAVAAVVFIAMFSVANLVYHVVRKPTELFYPLRSALDKSPAATWRDYGELFREYSTANVSPELLAALAQSEGAGNPVAHTYWRWRLTWHPFGIFEPASSAAGMYQMTDAAFDDARRYCIRDHVVVDTGCVLRDTYMRVVPSHAVELAAIYLDRNVAAVLGELPRRAASRQQKQDLAAIVHLCGAGPAAAFARRGFRLAADERCGDHDAASYLARVTAMTQLFAALGAGR